MLHATSREVHSLCGHFGSSHLQARVEFLLSSSNRDGDTHTQGLNQLGNGVYGQSRWGSTPSNQIPNVNPRWGTRFSRGGRKRGPNPHRGAGPCYNYEGEGLFFLPSPINP
mmetsp:Transcript_5907/g.6761  ORF Transcript_5907/g.6761 Transcript_5907/m.6761 type:complete len:111 (-) Transcript_5907:144-476(-)